MANSWTIVGLGNPGEEYEQTRHNVGRIIVDAFRVTHAFSTWHHEKKVNALVAEGTVGKHTIVLVMPETFMNKSGTSVKGLVKNPKSAQQLIVVQDDIDMPLGSLKIVFGRGSGGHRGIESIMRAIKTKEFVRLKIGILPTTPGGKLKKPKGEKKVLDFIMGKFIGKEAQTFKAVTKRAVDALEVIVTEGREKAMNEFNQ